MNFNYIDVPKNLDLRVLVSEFGTEAVNFYSQRLQERERAGKIYPKPLKTIYIWAMQDRKTNQGFYSTWRGFTSGRKNKNHGKS